MSRHRLAPAVAPIDRRAWCEDVLQARLFCGSPSLAGCSVAGQPRRGCPPRPRPARSTLIPSDPSRVVPSVGLGSDRSVTRNDRFHSRPLNLNRGTNYVMARRQYCCRNARFRKAIPMKDAKTLLLEFLAAVTRGQDAAALFAEDGAVELPFLHSVD